MIHLPISTSIAADALKNLKLNGKSNEITISVIQDKVAKYYHISVGDLKGKSGLKIL